MLKSFIDTFKSAFDYNGRTSRKDYWMFMLLSYLIPFLIAQVIIHIIGIDIKKPFDPEFSVNSFSGVLLILFAIYVLTIMIANLGLSIRRFHDIGKSGYFIFLGLVPYLGGFAIFTMHAFPGDVGDNLYGDDPYKDKYPSESDEISESFMQSRKEKIKKQKKIITIIASLIIALGVIGFITLIGFLIKDGMTDVNEKQTGTISQAIGGELLYNMHVTGSQLSKKHNIDFSYISEANDTTYIGSAKCKREPLLEDLEMGLWGEWFIVPVNEDLSTQLLMHNFAEDRTLLHNIDYKFVSANIYGEEKQYLKKNTFFYISEVYEDLVTIAMIDPNDVTLDGDIDPENIHYAIYQIDEETGKLSYYNMQFD